MLVSAAPSPNTIAWMKVRIDKLLVERGLVPSRERAQAMVLSGRVLVNEQKVEKAGAAVDPDAEIRLLGDDLKYVGRGGLKLEAALANWKIDLTGRHAWILARPRAALLTACCSTAQRSDCRRHGLRSDSCALAL